MNPTSTEATTVPAAPPRPPADNPRSLDIASKGIKTGRDFADFMSCLMSDIVAGRVTPQVGNAACNAGGKLLKVVEMQYKYGDSTPGRPKALKLALDDGE